MILNQTFTLSNGVQIPKLGLGTWLIPDNEAAAAVKASIDESLRKLGMDYADLIIIHCPQPWARTEKTVSCTTLPMQRPLSSR